MTLVPRSIIAIVVPTEELPFISPTFKSAIDAKRQPETINVPRREYNVCDGSLKGNGIIADLKAPPTIATSRNSPG